MNVNNCCVIIGQHPCNLNFYTHNWKKIESQTKDLFHLPDIVTRYFIQFYVQYTYTPCTLVSSNFPHFRTRKNTRAIYQTKFRSLFFSPKNFRILEARRVSQTALGVSILKRARSCCTPAGEKSKQEIVFLASKNGGTPPPKREKKRERNEGRKQKRNRGMTAQAVPSVRRQRCSSRCYLAKRGTQRWSSILFSERAPDRSVCFNRITWRGQRKMNADQRKRGFFPTNLHRSFVECCFSCKWIRQWFDFYLETFVYVWSI